MNFPAARSIAVEEWRYWLRSKTAISALIVVLLLLATSLVSTSAHINNERDAREQLQALAEETFRDQPARHPHRMVHYGHYVFRSPAPLAIADPGVEPYTGTVMFLEGHKQNSATFSPQYTRANAGPYPLLSPALAYQLLVPLLLIVVGFGSLSREHEARTDQLVFTMGISPGTFWLGKSMALAALALLALLPLGIVASLAWLQGENGLITLSFWLGYAVYLMCWAFLITAASAWSKQATTALLTLLACWVALSVLIPRVASSAADAWTPLNGKLQNDLAISRALRTVGDGHNASDPAFTQLRSQLLAQYEVDTVESLPINFRGLVAQTAERDLTDILNQFAEQRTKQERAQARLANSFSVLSPYLALKSFSISTANTDLNQHHRFLREAEAVRFAFVQGLNEVHTNDLAYSDDINRSVDESSSQRARVDAHHWRILDEFKPQPPSVKARLGSSLPFLLTLLAWTFLAATAGWLGARRSAWASHA